MAKYDKEALLADYHTGDYSQRQLAKMYRVSVGTVSTATKGLHKKTERLIKDKVELIQATDELTNKELNAFEHSVQFKVSMLREIEVFSQAAMKTAKTMIVSPESGNDFKAVVEGVDKLSILTRVNDRHAKSVPLQKTNINTGDITRVFHVVE